MREIIIEQARENNLKDISLRLPHYRLIVVTGVSGSGKTSLVYDVLYSEGQRLFLENFLRGGSSPAKLSRPKASRIEGLFPVVAIDQNTAVRTPRSTVGTLTEIYDLLRLLFARMGKADNPDIKLSRSLFSFNLPEGYCPECKGLGVQDHIDPEKLIDDPARTIRQGAFVLTTPNNYIVYSQVTMDVLDEVCRAEGFSVDIPWQDLSDDQKKVILYGSEKIKVLFGKHPLESRLKWSGITAKPREKDYYKGILPVMEDILRRDRNPNILRFARSYTCKHCHGKRLNDKALSVRLWERSIADFAAMTIKEIHSFFSDLPPDYSIHPVVETIRESILRRSALLLRLGAGHLTLDRESLSLKSGEAKRIRLANHVTGGLQNILYIIDEPSAGLHPSEHREMLQVLHELADTGNTVLLVDHDEQSIRAADWITDMGPGAGAAGGSVLFNGTAHDFFSLPVNESITRRYFRGNEFMLPEEKRTEKTFFSAGAGDENMRPAPRFVINTINVMTGVSGSGKGREVQQLIDALKNKTESKNLFRKIVHIDSSPIGRTPKSNPATYTGMSDHIRDLLALQPEARSRGFRKGQFSFVVKGGRCEECGGAGTVQIGMHFLGNVEVICDACEGKRFTAETLEIKYKGLNISDILEMNVDEANIFFQGHPRITAITETLADLGLGYLKLGQSSTTLSGGEAQRVKLASELSRQASGKTLYILDEPTAGLHMADVDILLGALNKLIDRGHTLLCIEHDPSFILRCGWITDLEQSSVNGITKPFTDGSTFDFVNHSDTLTARELRSFLDRYRAPAVPPAAIDPEVKPEKDIFIRGIETNNLKNIDVTFPANSITALTGVSGSGKSSLAYGTLYAECQRRFLEGKPSYIRQHTAKTGMPVIAGSSGLLPAVAIQKKNPVKNPRSVIATYTGLYDLYRLMYSRLGHSGSSNGPLLSSAFSYNSEEGACRTCRGLGHLTVCDAAKLITDVDKPLVAGALDGTKTGRFYGDPDGQYVATLLAVGNARGIDFTKPFSELDEQARELALNGCGDESFDVDWNYKRGSHSGTHHLTTVWPGFLHLVENEYSRKHNDARGEAMLALMKETLCPSCNGYRLRPERLEYRINGLNIGELNSMSADDALAWFGNSFAESFSDELERKAAVSFLTDISSYLNALQKAGLGYLSTDRMTGTLSGGEYQRLQLAGLTRSPLTGAAYILDEPSFGLHPGDTLRISDLITGLNEKGNTVVLVDHSPILLEKAHFFIELGPDAGDRGGEIVNAGRMNKHVIGELSNHLTVRMPACAGKGLSVGGACANNLRNIDMEIPSGTMTVVTGVSGSGKTSLLDKVIHASLAAGKPVNCSHFSGYDVFTTHLYIEQPLPGTGYNTTAGSRLGLSDAVAALFAAAAKSRGERLKEAYFLPGNKESRCPECEGAGKTSVSMDFFDDIVSPCERCGGTGFNDRALEITIDGKNINDVLQIPFNDLAEFLALHMTVRGEQKVHRTLELIEETGIGHLSCSRTLKTLSPGELQRIKLVSGLSVRESINTLILLDEPTGGLHPRDIEKLLHLFHRLTDEGNTIVCVTHEPMLMAAAGRTIELGPGGGSNGGMIINSAPHNSR